MKQYTFRFGGRGPVPVRCPPLRSLLAALLVCGWMQTAPAQSPAPDSFNPDADGVVLGMAIQGDCGVVLGGLFRTMCGQPRNRIARFGADGALDGGFNPGTDSDVYTLSAQPDGKILVGGNFTTVGGLSRSYLARLNADGTVDTNFNPSANGAVLGLAVQPDGKIVVGGWFTTVAGGTRNHIARLLPDGTLDTNFNAGSSSSWVGSLAVQPDGKIVAGGYFTSIGGQTRNYIARLNADGSAETSFNPGATGGYVLSVAVQPDGKILMGGAFTAVAGQSRSRIARLNAVGTLDTSFNPGASSNVWGMALQADGRILVGGDFITLGGQSRSRIACLNADGTVDTNFNPGADGGLRALAVQADGRTLVGGYFTSLAGQTRRCVGRLNNTGPVEDTLGCEGSTVTWLRGGTAPEVWRTTFERSPDGANWTLLGEGVRITGGWQVGGVSVTGETLRARGYACGGYQNGSVGIVETAIGAPYVVAQPADSTNHAGTIATFSVGALGSAPLGYRWRKEGVDLADDGNIGGAASATLSVSGLLAQDAGGYDAVVSNDVGSVTSVVATLTVVDPAINVQPASQFGPAGGNFTFSVTAAGTGGMNYQWRKDGDGIAGATNASLTLTNVQPSDAGAFDVIVRGDFGSVTSAVATLAVNLLDPGFDPGANSTVYALAVQPDGRILAGGAFTNVAGQARNRMARLEVDGTADTNFNPGASSTVFALAVQGDGRILAGGMFTNMAGQTRNYLARLEADGTADAAFNPGASREVYALAVQADGQILVGGAFTNVAGQVRKRVARLNAAGTPDSGFNPGANTNVYALALQADGGIVVGGTFTNLAGQTRNRIGRLAVDGTLDAGFNPVASNGVHALAMQADGAILVGGDFTGLGGLARKCIARLRPDGTLDPDFDPGAQGTVYALAIQADGRILVGGSFTNLAGQTRHRIGRLNADGTADPSFDPDAGGGDVLALALQADGAIVVGGAFTNLSGQARNRMARLQNTGPATDTLRCDGATVTWLRGGTAPEVWRTTFERTTNGTVWTLLGEGVRVAGGWELHGVSVTSGTLRARGYAAGGYHNGSAGIVETVLNAPNVAVQPASRTNNAGTTATFSVGVLGSAPFGYRWRKGGEDLAEGGNLAGTDAATLSVSGVVSNDMGGYDVIVSNAYGSATSAVAWLTVVDPAIGASPAGQAGQLGSNATFSVTAAGTGLTYQWRKDGIELPGATDSSLTVTNLQAADAGNYDVIVIGAGGSVTSAVAELSVNLALLDPGFDPGADNTVLTLSEQSAGQIVAGGFFAHLGGQLRNNIGRLDAAGVADPGFDPNADSNLFAQAVQPDGKIVVGGTFTNLCGQVRNRIARLNADGTLDLDFNPGADGRVLALAVQSDGKILVGGDFTMLGGAGHGKIGRLNADGTPDADFNPYVSGWVNTVAVQADGKILVGGLLMTVGVQNRLCLARLNPDGSLDEAFDPVGNNEVYTLAVQADGKILVGGGFSALGGQLRTRIARLNTDGSADVDFNPGANGAIYTVAVQADGKILVGGSFSTLGGATRNGIARLDAAGVPDHNFDPGADGIVRALAVLADGGILAAGNFTVLGGAARSHIGRLLDTEPATEELTCDGVTVTWRRGGTAPEVWRTTFEYSTNGTEWTLLGEGVRIPGGWERGGLSLASGTIRARGFTAGGYHNASGGLVETLVSGPALTAQPAGCTNDAGTAATFVVEAAGSEPLGYRWRKEGVDLADGGNIDGSAMATLNVSAVLGGDAGAYDVIVSNAGGSVTSAVAILTVVDPVIFAQPESRTNIAGTTATFSVGAFGTTPLFYQWRKEGVELQNGGKISGADAATLIVTFPLSGEAGAYSVLISNAVGRTVSSSAVLTILPTNVAVVVQSARGGGGTVSGGGAYAVGTQVAIRALANPGWAFTGWSDGVLDNPRMIVATAGAPPYTANFASLAFSRSQQLVVQSAGWADVGLFNFGFNRWDASGSGHGTFSFTYPLQFNGGNGGGFYGIVLNDQALGRFVELIWIWDDFLGP